MPEGVRVKALDIVKTVTALLESGVSIEVVKEAFKIGGLGDDEVEFLIGYISEMESSRLINIANQYIDEMKKGLNDVIKLLLEAD